MNQPVKNNIELSADEIADFLENNTDFFQQYPDVFLKMKLSEQPDGSISLVERQMRGLRQRNKELEVELQQVIRNAQDNQQLLQQTISLTLQLIPCSEITTLTETLFEQLSELFNIEYRNLLLDNRHFSDMNEMAVNMQTIREILGDNFPNKQPVCGRLKNVEKESLFTNSSKVNSAAILPLGEAGELGLLVLGSEDETHFDPEMGDLFLSLISDMLGRLLCRFK